MWRHPHALQVSGCVVLCVLTEHAAQQNVAASFLEVPSMESAATERRCWLWPYPGPQPTCRLWPQASAPSGQSNLSSLWPAALGQRVMGGSVGAGRPKQFGTLTYKKSHWKALWWREDAGSCLPWFWPSLGPLPTCCLRPQSIAHQAKAIYPACGLPRSAEGSCGGSAGTEGCMWPQTDTYL